MPDFYTQVEALEGTNLDKATVWKRLQVKLNLSFGYRKWIGIYEVIEDVAVAVSKVEANPSYGPGGPTQYYIGNSSKSLRLVDKIKLE